MQLQVPNIWVLKGATLIRNTLPRINIPVSSQIAHLKTQNQLSSQGQCSWYLTLNSFLACLLIRKLTPEVIMVKI